MDYRMSANSQYGTCVLRDSEIEFVASRKEEQAFFTLELTFPQWEEDCFLLMPACVYHGNRQKCVQRNYPPMYLPQETGVNCQPLMTDLPALHPDGSGKIQVTSGDMATPCVGIFNREKQEGFFLFTEQEVKGRNLGFTLEKGRLEISYPANRTRLYRHGRPYEQGGDKGIWVLAGERITSSFLLISFPCIDLKEFYHQFFRLRKSFLKGSAVKSAYTKELWDLMEQHFNQANFSGEYYAEASKTWQCGWVGGGMSVYPLLKYGSELSVNRAVQTLDYMTKHQAESGFYYGIVKNGVVMDDSFSTPGMEHLHLLRKSADVLYFWFKNFEAIPPKESWIESARRCADGFVTLFDRYGQVGQFVNVKTGELVVGNSTSAAIVSAALAKAWEYFGNEEYLRVARESLELHWQMFLKQGMTNGGPGEILGAPDSESGFGLLESCVVLYEVTKAEKWLSYAETVAHYCSSWVVSYPYRFPKGSEFHRLGIDTTGSVFANVQNKHSAPGICTLSGDSLLKLYRYTGKEDYLTLLKEIACFIPQCVSTKEKPIYSWNDPPKQLPYGYINERVNLSDWEGFERIGGVFYGTCWPETSLILSFAELMTQEEFR